MCVCVYIYIYVYLYSLVFVMYLWLHFSRIAMDVAHRLEHLTLPWDHSRERTRAWS